MVTKILKEFARVTKILIGVCNGKYNNKSSLQGYLKY